MGHNDTHLSKMDQGSDVGQPHQGAKEDHASPKGGRPSHPTQPHHQGQEGQLQKTKKGGGG
jgi:hypothetical protein